jgi:hypothetical protein
MFGFRPKGKDSDQSKGPDKEATPTPPPPKVEKLDHNAVVGETLFGRALQYSSSILGSTDASSKPALPTLVMHRYLLPKVRSQAKVLRDKHDEGELPEGFADGVASRLGGKATEKEGKDHYLKMVACIHQGLRNDDIKVTQTDPSKLADDWSTWLGRVDECLRLGTPFGELSSVQWTEDSLQKVEEDSLVTRRTPQEEADFKAQQEAKKKAAKAAKKARKALEKLTTSDAEGDNPQKRVRFEEEGGGVAPDEEPEDTDMGEDAVEGS